MCVTIPAQITDITGDALAMATVDVAGRSVECCLAYVPDAVVGDYVLVQNKFAIELLTAEAAKESLAAFADLGVIDGPGE
jgi:hydrogenase expression/formation protein HypC